MKNFIFYTLLISFFAPGCYYSTIKKNKPAASPANDSVVHQPAISEAEFKRYYNASEQFYEHILERSQFSGEFLVAKKGEIIFERYAGYSNISTKDSLNANSALHLASVSKTFTAMAVLKLWEEGKLSISDEASVYLPGFPYEGVTVKTLLNHRSGLPNYVHVMEQLGWNRKKIVYNADVLQFLVTNKSKLQVARPNRSFHYCNTNYALLALIIEKVSGLPYPQFIYENFFAPLGMTNSYVFTMSDSLKALPSYNYKNKQEAFTFLDAVYGDKNIYSTVRDLLKWETALSYGNMFKQSTLDSAYAGYSYEKKGIKNYGLGWRMLEYPNEEKIIYHNGWWHGNNTVFARIIKDSATIIILGNKYNRNIYQAKKLFPAFGDYATEEDTEE
ncbi:serine hydrolase domain-containing protein [Agriterribacter sp.]|nr:serine hydrolase domain-containing protein [Agriterribacter sp.]HRO47085.1 serine hydrolase domain-containing protein [Agriterribacter sp.]